MKRRVCFLVVISVACLTCVAASAARLEAQVVAVIDGDTVLLKPVVAGRLQSRFYKLRLADIDAPERDQTFGAEAQQGLAQLVAHKRVRVKTVATDRYGRRIGWLTLTRHDASLDINGEMVRRGAAWASSRHRRGARLRGLQHEARAARRGLWADAAPIPPWKWRARRPAAADF